MAERLLYGITGTKFLLSLLVIALAAVAMFTGRMTGAEFGTVANAALLFYAGANWLNNRDTVKATGHPTGEAAK